MIYSAYKL